MCNTTRPYDKSIDEFRPDGGSETESVDAQRLDPTAIDDPLAVIPDAYEHHEDYARERFTHRETGLTVELSRQASRDQWDDARGWHPLVRETPDGPAVEDFNLTGLSYHLPTKDEARRIAAAYLAAHADGRLDGSESLSN